MMKNKYGHSSIVYKASYHTIYAPPNLLMPVVVKKFWYEKLGERFKHLLSIPLNKKKDATDGKSEHHD